jgi:hypothetical protein
MTRHTLLLSLALALLSTPSFAYDFGLSKVATSAIGVGCYDVKTADVDGDGRPDVVAAVFDAQRLAVVLGSPTGLGAVTFYPSGHANAVDLADFDGNGSIDILEADWDENQVRLWTNSGSGTFLASATIPVATHPRDVASGDFDGNGTRDVAVATGDGKVVILSGQAGGGFAAAGSLTIGGVAKGIAAGDLDNDGDIDLVVIDAAGKRIYLLRNDGALSFVQASSKTFQGNPSDVALGLLDGDAFLDAAVSLENATVAVVQGGATGFNAMATFVIGSLSQSVAIADMDGEGGPDLLVSNYNESTVQVLRNQSGLQFGLPVVAATGSNPRSAAAADVNLDGRADVVSGDFLGGTVSLLRSITASPQVSIVPSSLEFGSGGQGYPTVKTLKVRNSGTTPLTVTPGAIDGAEFAYAEPVEPFSVQAGSEATLGIRYEHANLGNATGTLHLATNDPLAPEVSVPLSGFTAPADPEVSYQPTFLDFGLSYQGDQQVKSVLFQNTGNAPLTITPGPIDGDEFVYADTNPNPPFTLVPGAQYPVGIRYNRSALGNATGTWHLTTSDANAPDISINLQGSAEPAVTELAYSPASLDFGNGTLGFPDVLPVSFQNVGNTLITVTPGTIDGSQFVYAGSNLPFSIQPGVTKTLSIRCQRTVGGAVTGTLHLTSNDPDHATIDIPLSATTQFPAPKIAWTPTSLDFGSKFDGIQQVLSVTVQNVGHVTLHVNPGAIDGSQFVYDGSSAAFTLAVGATRSLAIRYLRSVTGPATGTLHLASDDPDVPDAAIALAGASGPPPLASFSAPSPITVSAGTAMPTSFVVRNLGSSPLEVTVPPAALDYTEASPFDMGTTDQEFWRLDPSGALWNFDPEGRVKTGNHSEYYWGMDEANFLAQTTGTIGLGGREFRLGPVSVAPGIKVTRKIYIPEAGNWVRYIDVAENPNADARVATFDLFDNLGYIPQGLIQTSDGDAQFELSDDWIVVPAEGPTRSVGRVFRSVGAANVPVLATWFQTIGSPGCYSRTKYVATLPAHSRACVIQWAVQAEDPNVAAATLEALRQDPTPGLVHADAIDRATAWNLVPGANPFRPVDANYVIPPNDSANIAVVYGAEAATHDANLTSVLRLVTNDPAHPVLAVPLAFSIGNGQVVGVDPPPAAAPATLELAGFRPNPVRLSGGARVAFRLVSAEPATLTLYDVRGRTLARHQIEAPAPGPGSVILSRASLAAGVVWMRLEQGGKVATGKGIVLP